MAAEEKGAEILFRRLSEVAKLTSRDMNVLILGLGEINKTEALVDYYEANKERLLVMSLSKKNRSQNDKR